MSSSLTTFNLTGIPRTLLMPLWGRARATLANSRILSDPKAVEISRKLEVDFEKISRVLPASNDLVSIARARVLDELIRRFLSKHPRATIVNLGAQGGVDGLCMHELSI